MSRKVLRRIFGAGAVASGGLLIWLTPADLAGAFIIAAAIAIEVTGILLER